MTTNISCRVDWLEVAYKVPKPDWLEPLQIAANLARRAKLKIAGLEFMLNAMRRVSVSPFENADCHGEFNRTASGGWSLVIRVRATYLATHSLSDALKLLRRIAAGFGPVTGERLRRFDLAADYVDFPLRHEDFERIQAKRVRTRGAFVPEQTDVNSTRLPTREHRSTPTTVTGFTVGKGCLLVRIYDKTTELNLPGRENKRPIEHERWHSRGWDGQAQVTRVEFQHRGEFLDETQLRELDKLPDQLDAVWQHDTQWLRLICPETATRRERCALDPRWACVQKTRFAHDAAPIPRTRAHRGGAKSDLVVGATLSREAARGALSPIVMLTSDREELPPSEFAEGLSSQECVEWLRRQAERRVIPGARSATWDYAQRLVTKHGPQKAVEAFIHKVNGNRARFFSVDDERKTQ